MFVFKGVGGKIYCGKIWNAEITCLTLQSRKFGLFKNSNIIIF